jgi:hypothetical protein
MRQTVVLIAAIVVSGFLASPGLAIKQQQPAAGGVQTRKAFSCDVNENTCTCKGSKLGADCKAMARTCDGAIVPLSNGTGFWCVMK